MAGTLAPRRPIMRYHGGKWRLADWIISFFPQHRIYCEPFGGAASVLAKKPRSYAEVYNDVNNEMVNLFRVLRDPAQAKRLASAVHLTPYARAEFKESFVRTDDPVEQARRTLFRSAAGFSTAGAHADSEWKTGFRGCVTRSHTTPSHDWSGMPPIVEAFCERLQGVVVENLNAVELIVKYDHADALFYLDPTYPFSTRHKRWAGRAYQHELTDDDHRRLAATLNSIRGMAVLSGYACELYDRDLYSHWQRYERPVFSDRAQRRVEVLWVNGAANARKEADQAPELAVAAIPTAVQVPTGGNQ